VYKYRKNQIKYLENLQQVKLEYEKSLLEIQLEIQEKTLQHLAQEIHDNCNQKLSLAKLHLNTINYSEQENVKNNVENSINVISNVINDLSNLSHSMSSEILFQNGLVSALKNEIAQLEKLNLFNLEMKLKGEESLIDHNKELVIFRIAQEAIHNIIKHSKATLVNIDLEFANHELILNIRDNGVGFSIDEMKSNRIGLSNMSQRTKIFNGDLFIESEPDLGTLITAKIPL